LQACGSINQREFSSIKNGLQTILSKKAQVLDNLQTQKQKHPNDDQKISALEQAGQTEIKSSMKTWTLDTEALLSLYLNGFIDKPDCSVQNGNAGDKGTSWIVIHFPMDREILNRRINEVTDSLQSMEEMTKSLPEVLKEEMTKLFETDSN
jgi:hypothetical protein